MLVASSGWKRSFTKIALGLAFVGVLLLSHSATGQDDLHRRVKTKVAPTYPALARRSSMNITGTVKIHVVVAPDGNIKESKVVGGHPLLVGAAMDALKKWKFEPASEESSGTVEFNFAPQ